MPKNSLANDYTNRLPLLNALAEKLETSTRDALDGVRHIDRISFRVKKMNSFLTKASQPENKDSQKPKYEDPFTEIEDQVAGRVITFFRDDIDEVKKHLIHRFGAVEHEAKEPSGPSEFGYESDHFVFIIADHHKPDGWDDLEQMPKTFELQVRTLFMHAWAEPQHELGYKSDSELDRDANRQLAWIAASAWGADQTLNRLAKKMREKDPSISVAAESNFDG